MATYHESKRIWVNGEDQEIPICPDCKDHIRIPTTEVEVECDCKNTFYKINEEGKQECVGQCCCYSEEHI